MRVWKEMWRCHDCFEVIWASDLLDRQHPALNEVGVSRRKDIRMYSDVLRYP